MTAHVNRVISTRTPKQIFRSIKELNLVKRYMLAIPIKSKPYTCPFGYRRVDDMWQPIETEFEALLQARKYLETCSYKEVADWVSATTQRPLTYNGLFNLMRDRMPADEIIINEDGKPRLLDLDSRIKLYTDSEI